MFMDWVRGSMGYYPVGTSWEWVVSCVKLIICFVFGQKMLNLVDFFFLSDDWEIRILWDQPIGLTAASGTRAYASAPLPFSA